MGPTVIGLLIFRSKSTISREMRRQGTDLPYEAKLNHAAAPKRRTKARRPTRSTAVRLVEIEAGLRQGHCPQQIAGRWEQEGRPVEERLSYETIYQIIIKERRAGGQWYRLLPMGGRKRRRDRTGKKRDRLKIKPEQELAARPERINGRTEFGHWEVDLVIGARQEGVLLVAVERVSRLSGVFANHWWSKRSSSAAKVMKAAKEEAVLSDLRAMRLWALRRWKIFSTWCLCR